MRVPLGSVKLSSTDTDDVHVSMPIAGAWAIDFEPTVGKSASQTDPISIVAKELFRKVREKFSGSIEADPPDFVIYLMALDSIFSYLSWLKRVYRTVTYYDANNLQLPDTILLAMGFSDANIIQMRRQKMQLFQSINELVAMSEKFQCPAVMDVMNRHHWMNEHVYGDVNSVNCQTFFFNQRRYYQYQLVKTPDDVLAGGLQPISIFTVINNTNVTDVVQAMFDFGRNLINALAASDSAYIISGYLMRAFEGTPTFAVAPLVLGETLSLVWDETVLPQIQNARAVGATRFDDTRVVDNTVAQDPKTNIILCDPVIVLPNTAPAVTNHLDGIRPVINIRSFSPSVEEVVEATRLTNDFRARSTGESVSEFTIVCGTEIVLSHELRSVDTQGNIVALGINGVSALDATDAGLLLGFASQWDWHPQVVSLWQRLTPTSTVATAFIIGDVMNLTSLSEADMDNINRVVLYSEFNAFNIS